VLQPPPSLEQVQQEGPKWSRIVQQLPGRTVSSVRNRWRAQLALRAPSWRPADTRLGAAHRQRIEKGRKLREAGIESKNRCHACGEPKRGHICYQKLRGGPQVELRSPVRQGEGGEGRGLGFGLPFEAQDRGEASPPEPCVVSSPARGGRTSGASRR